MFHYTQSHWRLYSPLILFQANFLLPHSILSPCVLIIQLNELCAPVNLLWMIVMVARRRGEIFFIFFYSVCAQVVFSTQRIFVFLIRLDIDLCGSFTQQGRARGTFDVSSLGSKWKCGRIIHSVLHILSPSLSFLSSTLTLEPVICYLWIILYVSHCVCHRYMNVICHSIVSIWKKGDGNDSRICTVIASGCQLVCLISLNLSPIRTLFSIHLLGILSFSSPNNAPTNQPMDSLPASSGMQI